MEDLSKTHLLRRDGHYYFRIRVPKELVGILGKREIKKSLKTSDPREADKRLPIEQLEAQELFEQARKKLSPPHISRNTKTPPSSTIHLTSHLRAIKLWHEREKKERLDSLATDFPSGEWLYEAREGASNELAEFSKGETGDVSATIIGTTRKLFKDQNLDFPVGKRDQEFLYEAMRKALFEQARSELAALEPSFKIPPTPYFEQEFQLTLAELVEEFKRASRQAGKTQKTIDGYEGTFNFALEYFGGDSLVKDITTGACRDLFEKLAELPANAKKRFPELTLLQACDRNDVAQSDKLTKTTLENYLKNFRALMNFAVEEEHLLSNPARNVKLNPKNKATGGRVPFTVEQLQKLFNAPIYTGCKDDEAGAFKAGDTRPRRHKFWIPLLGLWTGARLNEICQLYTEDVTSQERVPVILITDETGEDQRLKTKQSKRAIPIHPELVKVGFLGYVEEQRKKGEKYLFPDLSVSKSGSRSDNFSKWFGHFRDRTLGTYTGTNFHSFRHTFRDAIREAELDKEIGARLGGWQGTKDVMDTYGKGHSIIKLQKAIAKIRLNGLNLTHLFKP